MAREKLKERAERVKSVRDRMMERAVRLRSRVREAGKESEVREE